MQPDYSKIEIIKQDSYKAPPFKNLQQFYEFEFSPITKEKTNTDGLYDQDEIKNHYWCANGTETYVAYIDGIPAGFAAVNLGSMVTNDPNTRDIADFFVMPAYRNSGVGKKIAFHVFDLYPHQWEVRQFDFLHEAKKFWRKIIKEYSSGSYEEFLHEDDHWKERLTVQRFKSKSCA